MATEDPIKKQLEEMLLPALRQYQHNDCSGFVAGYDREEVLKILRPYFPSSTGKISGGTCLHIPDLQWGETCTICGSYLT